MLIFDLHTRRRDCLLDYHINKMRFFAERQNRETIVVGDITCPRPCGPWPLSMSIKLHPSPFMFVKLVKLDSIRHLGNKKPKIGHQQALPRFSYFRYSRFWRKFSKTNKTDFFGFLDKNGSVFPRGAAYVLVRGGTSASR